MRYLVWLLAMLLGETLGLTACSKEVGAPNRAPVAVLMGDLESPHSEAVLLDGSRSFDPDGDQLSYEWSLLSTNASLAEFSFEDKDEAWAVFSSSLVGDHWLGLVVSDGELFSRPAIMRLRLIAACESDADCDDGNPCTDDACDDEGRCRHSPNTAPCDDEDACTRDDVCADGRCAGSLIDDDGDGQAPAACGGSDCDDDPEACGALCFADNPDPDICDGWDNDCDGQTDEDPELEWFFDGDGDDYGAPESVELACVAPGVDYVSAAGDCDDGDADVNPDAIEICNNRDDNCDGVIDEDLFDCGCRDGLAAPAAEEICDNGIDDDCDGEIDEGCQICEPGQRFCDADGRSLHLCLADGLGWDLSETVLCGWFCHANACVEPSTVSQDVMGLCDTDSMRLAPPGGDIIYNGGSLNCAQGCDPLSPDADSIQALAGTAVTGLAVFCLSEIQLPAASKLIYAGRDLPPMILLVTGSANLAGSIEFDGQAPANSTSGGIAGPGGGDGAEECSGQSCTGLVGEGDGGGGGGRRASGSTAGGGGGGGYGGAGGVGGDADGDPDGGSAGAIYGNAEIQPLLGGSGGGSGGDGQGGTGSGPGGGSGGVLQLTVRSSLSLSGTLSARGGAGYRQVITHGAGGGGSGGAILLEAPELVLGPGSRLLVEGGAGGAVGESFAAGAADNAMDGDPGVPGSGTGGGGGGGGSGRVRLNSVNGAPCQNTSPAGACSAQTY